MIHIPNVERKLLLPGESIPAIHLRPARYARQRFMTARLFRRVELQVLHQQRARTYEAHVVLEHVDQLRQFIQATAPQKPAEPRQALGIGQKVTLPVAAVVHSAKLEQGERLSSEARTTLLKKNGRA